MPIRPNQGALATPKKEATPWNSTPPKRENKVKKGSEVDANGPKRKKTSIIRDYTLAALLNGNQDTAAYKGMEKVRPPRPPK